MKVDRRNLLWFLPLAGVLLFEGAGMSAHKSNSGLSMAVIGKQSEGVYLVPTGQTLTPVGKNVTFDGRPVDMAFRPDGGILAVMLQNGIRLFDPAKGEFQPGIIAGGGAFGGLAWSHDGKTLYASTEARGSQRGEPNLGAVEPIHFDEQGTATVGKPITFPLQSRIKPNRAAVNSAPSGLALSRDEHTLYVSLFNNATVCAIDLTSYSPDTGDAKRTEIPVGSSPEKVLLSADGNTLYVANRGGRVPQSGDTVDPDDPVVVDPDTYRASTGTISAIDLHAVESDPDRAVKSISVGLQPVDMALSPDGTRLYAANANSDSVSVIDTSVNSVVETINTSPAPGGLAASSPNGLTVASDGGTLYVTLGGDNAVEIVSLDHAAGGRAASTRIEGLIPTAWFPMGCQLSHYGKTLYVANSKGVGSLGDQQRHNVSEAATPEMGPGGTIAPKTMYGHTVYAVLGSLGVIPVPSARDLRQYTTIVARDDHFDRMSEALSRPNDPFWSRFKHVVMVIKENKTYDQVFGDVPLPSGHIGGDPSLVMFGEKITPNHHALAHEFGLFDNIYCSGAISADGHHWVNESFADDYSERAMSNYPRSYPCCGRDPLVYAGNKFLWQAAMDAGMSFRDYGEFEPLPSMYKHADQDYNARFQAGPDRNRDVAHAETIVADIAKDDPAHALPQLTYVWFPNDHTSGTRPGSYTPESCLADNDLGLGKLVDAISHSKRYWQDEPTAIFVIEDDAQGGLDHIDGHRTVGLVISPYCKRGQICSTNFNQLNMMRTMEAMLGLKPLNQFDAAAVTMRSVFTDHPDFRPYDVRKNQIALNSINPPLRRLSGSARRLAAESLALDFSKPDRADPEKLTEILWGHTHGTKYPPVSAAIN
jgi:YVTN family beta-propeller protein